MPLTSSWKKNAMREGPARPYAARRAPAGDRRAPSQLSQCRSYLHPAGQLLGISWYLPDESILNRKNFPLTRSPWESNVIGCPRIVAGSFVFLIAASTLARLGVWPDLQTAAMALSITCVAANTGGPNVPKDPYFVFA